jgi:hypothetical protein
MCIVDELARVQYEEGFPDIAAKLLQLRKRLGAGLDMPAQIDHQAMEQWAMRSYREPESPELVAMVEQCMLPAT